MWQYNYNIPVLADDELMHYGVLGMKWGHRKQRISNSTKIISSNSQQNSRSSMSLRIHKSSHPSSDSGSKNTGNKKSTKRKVATGLIAAGATVAAGYGAYKLSEFTKSTAAKKSIEYGKKYIDGHPLFTYDPILPEGINVRNQLYNEAMDQLNKRTHAVKKSTKSAIKFLTNKDKSNERLLDYNAKW